MERSVPMRRRHNSIRLADFDYSSQGAYAVTICTYTKIPYLADPICLTLVEEAWGYIPIRFPTVSLDNIAVMPDHLHCILWLNPTEEQKPELGVIVRKFKGDITRGWLRHFRKSEDPKNGEKFSIWQTRFHDDIIRSTRELEAWHRYIQENPEKHRHQNEKYQ